MNIISLSTAGKAAMRNNDGIWIGSLTEWNTLTGYWANVYIDGNMETIDTLTFSFINSEGLSRKNEKKISGLWKYQIPIGYEYLQSTNQAFYFIDEIKDLSISRIIYTDIENEGTKTGPNLKETLSLSNLTKIPIVVSGGISSIKDVLNIKNKKFKNIEGVIIGKAIYDGNINLKELSKLI